MKVTDYHPSTAVPDLSGKVILLTGGTAGLGREMLLLLAAHHPAHIFFTGRNASAAQAVTSELQAAAGPGVPVTFLECDMGSVATIKTAAEQFKSSGVNRLDLLICNAGIMAAPAGVTKDGHEVQFGTNFVGHAALIQLLLPTLLSTAAQPASDVRVLLATSQGYMMHPKGGIVFSSLNSDQSNMNTWSKYAQAKLAAVLWARELEHRYPQLRSVSVHPGTANTALVGKLGFFSKALVYVTNVGKFITPQQAAYNMVWCATTPREELEGGAYYEPVGNKTKIKGDGTNVELGKRLWEWSEAELKKFGVEA
jgi:NAD(P)-dependent dehydrogenase (short-subunit alcohol dehydrogenase family)